MNVSEFAKSVGVTAETVRYYTRIGLLAPTRNTRNGYSCYSSSDLARLLFIRRARLLGFSLKDVSDILRESSYGHSPCPQVRQIMTQRLQETRLKLRDLQKLQVRMEFAATLWAHMPDGYGVCHLIEKFAIED